MSAIFILVILTALGAFIVSISGLQQSSSALDVLGAQAYQAARAGTEWGAYRILRNGGTCAASTPLTFPGTGLAAFTTTVQCSSSTTTEASTTVTVYQVLATACNQPVAGNCPNPAPAAGYVERQLSTTLATP